ncbi:Hsp20/alpha crystallin family protein [Neobacillus niacini]|uniref:Hsp20/alpha crystallin family protein n=1 Tax=Neobacillus niacini TaxID=86668 RepID=UPI0005EDB212|nr:Hsp20/alpha crystallin family protein [Neobacillus niacini]
MDYEKIKQWMEITQKYQNGKFWEMVFDENSHDQLEEDEGRNVTPKEKPPLMKYPTTDIFQTETDIILILEVPGAIKEDISLSFSGTKLTVRGLLRPPMIQGVTIKSERKYGEFERNINLPEPVDSKDIFARFENGLLIISYKRRYTREETIMIR